MRKQVVCKLDGSARYTYRYRQLNSDGEPIENNWEKDAVVGATFYLCKVALKGRRAAPEQITVTVEY